MEIEVDLDCNGVGPLKGELRISKEQDEDLFMKTVSKL